MYIQGIVLTILISNENIIRSTKWLNENVTQRMKTSVVKLKCHSTVETVKQ
jgi:hypothetical protein